MLGLPGAGKGTQAKKISIELKIPHLSTGDIFRAEIASGTPLGNQVKDLIDKGLLVPDDVTINVINQRLRSPDCADGFVLDGFPRTVEQATALDNLLKSFNVEISSILYIKVSENELLGRLVGRRICRDCGEIYHVDTLTIEKCRECGGELKIRADDERQTVLERIKVNASQTEYLVDFYAASGKLLVIDGSKPADKVTKAILTNLGLVL